jgi:hypothetical protein
MLQAIAEWWDATRWVEQGDSGGLMVDEPRVILGQKLPDSAILWTKDVRLLQGRGAARRTRKAPERET